MCTEDAPLNGLAVSHRILKNNEVYHSLSHSRKGHSCSYLVQFEETGELQYGIILYYVASLVNYAIIRVYLCPDITIFPMVPSTDALILELVQQNVIGQKCVAVKETDEVIPCVDILTKCIFVESQQIGLSGFVITVAAHEPFIDSLL